MSISFTLSKLEELYEEFFSTYITYKNSIEDLNSIIKELELYWKSDETNTYQEFLKLYHSKEQKLLDAGELMKHFSDILIKKKEELENATVDAINNFE